MKGGRGFGWVVVDEVDRMFIDEADKKVQKGASVPGFHHLRKVLMYMWIAQNLTEPSVRPHEDGKLADVVRYSFDEQQQVNHTEVLLRDVDPLQYIGERVSNFTLQEVLGSLMSDTDRTVRIPKYLLSHTAGQVRYWVESMQIARYHHSLNVTYTVANEFWYSDGSRPPHRIVVPISVESGELEYNLNIDDGQTQFMQIANSLAMTSESLTSDYYSYPSYFLKYRGRILGLTGTIGEWYCIVAHMVDNSYSPPQAWTTTSSTCSAPTEWTSSPCLRSRRRRPAPFPRSSPPRTDRSGCATSRSACSTTPGRTDARC